jgi:hypothetical protein
MPKIFLLSLRKTDTGEFVRISQEMIIGLFRQGELFRVTNSVGPVGLEPTTHGLKVRCSTG